MSTTPFDEAGRSELSAAEREWRRALRASGCHVAPSAIGVHPSQFTSPRADKRAAEAAYREFLAVEPCHPVALAGLAFLLQHRGAIVEASSVRRRAYAVEARQLGVPEQDAADVVAFLAASMGDGAAPASVPTAYLERLFDGYSETYDEHLTAKLEYRGPAQLLEITGSVLGAALHDVDILDLGCGTGLVGKAFRAVARRQTGVDLSGRMLARARESGVYDELFQADIEPFLRETGRRFDLVLAGDVLNYIGDLRPVLAGIERALGPGGLCALTVESGTGADYRLCPSRRYRHGRRYLERVAAEARLDLFRIEGIELRFESSLPVSAWLACGRRRG